MNNRTLKKTMTHGALTAGELYDALFGAGSGNNEQFRKLTVEFGGVTLKMDDEDWYPGRSADAGLPVGAAQLVWSHTGQRCSIDRGLLLSLLDARANERANNACREAERDERLGHTKTLPRGWSYEAGFVVNENNEIV